MNEWMEKRIWQRHWETKVVVVMEVGIFTKGLYGKGKEGWQLENTPHHIFPRSSSDAHNHGFWCSWSIDQSKSILILGKATQSTCSLDDAAVISVWSTNITYWTLTLDTPGRYTSCSGNLMVLSAVEGSGLCSGSLASGNYHLFKNQNITCPLLHSLSSTSLRLYRRKWNEDRSLYYQVQAHSHKTNSGTSHC